MLILSRKINESVVIDGEITVKIVRIDGDHVRLGIQAPNDVPVHRQEVYDEIQRTNREAVQEGRPPLDRLPRPALARPNPSLPGKDAPTPAHNLSH